MFASKGILKLKRHSNVNETSLREKKLVSFTPTIHPSSFLVQFYVVNLRKDWTRAIKSIIKSLMLYLRCENEISSTIRGALTICREINWQLHILVSTVIFFLPDDSYTFLSNWQLCDDIDLWVTTRGYLCINWDIIHIDDS